MGAKMKIIQKKEVKTLKKGIKRGNVFGVNIFLQSQYQQVFFLAMTNTCTL